MRRSRRQRLRRATFTTTPADPHPPMRALATRRPASRAAPAASLRRGGRPPRRESERLGERILDAATELFLLHGYGVTSIEAVARHAHVSKRTFYHRFADKRALFAAVVHRIIDRLRPPAGLPSFAGEPLELVLRTLAGLILHAALAPEAVALNRLIVAESARFPELAAAVTAEGSTQGAIRLIEGLLERERSAGRLALAVPGFAAEQFLWMVMTVPQRRATGLGVPMTTAEREAWTRDVVALFLNGCRGETKETKRVRP